MLSCLEGSERKLEVLFYLLKEGSASVSQISQELKLREDLVREILESLKRKGIVVDYPSGVCEVNYSSPIVSILLSVLEEVLNC